MDDQVDIVMEIIGMDVDRLEAEFDKAFDEGMDKLRDEIEKTWHEKASSQLNTTKDKYIAGLSVERIGEGITATLTGFLPVSLEQGRERYDMKPGLLGNAVSRIIPIGKSSGQQPDFRRVRQDSAGWWHPGFQAKQIHKQVQSEVDERMVPEIFGDLISRISV